MTWPTLPAFNTANFLDHFDSLDTSKWTAVTSGSGSVTVTDSYLKCDTGAASSAAFAYYNTKLDKTKSQLWMICAAGQQATAPQGQQLFNLLNGASAPAADTIANILAKTLARAVIDVADTSIAHEHWNSAGTRNWWNPATPAWETAAASAIPDARTDDYYITGIEIDGGNSRWRLFDVGQSFATAGTYEFDQGWRLFSLTDWVAWGNTRSNADIWLVLGWPYTEGLAQSETRIEWVRYAEALPGNTVIDSWVMSKESASAQNHRIRHLYSYDGLTFVPQDRTTWALDIGTGGQPDDTELERPRAVWDGGTDWMFYTGFDGSVKTVCVSSANYARPQNGPWTKYGSNPIINVGSAGANDDAGANVGDVVKDLTEPDSDKRWKLLYTGTKNSDGKNRIMYATAPSPTGTWTKQATVIDVGGGGSYDEDGASDAVIVHYKGQWEVWYEAIDASSQVTLRRTYGTDLASLTKDTTDYTSTVTSAKQALTADLTSAPGRTVTVASTTDFVKDAAVVFGNEDTNQDTYCFSKIRKIVSATQFELYHGVTGPLASGTPWKVMQRDAGSNRSPRVIIRVGSEWWFYETFWDPWTAAADPLYGSLVESMYLATHSGDGPSDAIAVLQQQPSPVNMRGFNNDQRSHENMTLLNPAFSSGIAWTRA